MTGKATHFLAIYSYLSRAIDSIKHWQIPTGGFGGGGDQLAHLATTYAAVNALAILGTKEAYEAVDR